jgi:hypothetical protein
MSCTAHPKRCHVYSMCFHARVTRGIALFSGGAEGYKLPQNDKSTALVCTVPQRLRPNTRCAGAAALCSPPATRSRDVTHRQQGPHDPPADDSSQHHRPRNNVWHQEATANVLLLEVKPPCPFGCRKAKGGPAGKAAAVAGALKQPACKQAQRRGTCHFRFQRTARNTATAAAAAAVSSPCGVSVLSKTLHPS